MKPEVILFSRTPKEDYQYLFMLPPYISAASRAFIQSQLEQMQGGATDGVVHFFFSSTDAVLLRLVDSGCKDVFSRPIYSLEGIYCPANDVRKCWLCLPFWVPGFWSSPSLYQRLVSGERTVSVPLTQLLDDFDARSQMHPQMQAMRNEILRADEPVSFTFDANGFHPAAALPAHGRKQWIPQEARRCSLQLTLLRKEKNAYLAAVSDGNPAYTVLRSEDIAGGGRDGWNFAELESAACAMERELDACGWQYAEGDEL